MLCTFVIISQIFKHALSVKNYTVVEDLTASQYLLLQRCLDFYLLPFLVNMAFADKKNKREKMSYRSV